MKSNQDTPVLRGRCVGYGRVLAVHPILKLRISRKATNQNAQFGFWDKEGLYMTPASGITVNKQKQKEKSE